MGDGQPRSLIRVVNVRGLRTPDERAGVVYVGRPFAGWKGHPLANPFKIHRPRPDPLGPQWSASWDEEDEAKARAECIERYRTWVEARPTLLADLASLWAEIDRGAKPLGCWCHPAPCHAHVLAGLLAQEFDA